MARRNEDLENDNLDSLEEGEAKVKTRKVLCLVRDDSNLLNVRNVKRVIESDETISRLLQHAWCVEVLRDPYTGKAAVGEDVVVEDEEE